MQPISIPSAVKRFINFKNKKMTKQEMNASEAVYGFAAWLTCRKEKTTFSSKHNCAPIAELVKLFCETNKLKEPRKNWQKRLTHPNN